MICPLCKGKMETIRTYPDRRLNLNFRLINCLVCNVRQRTVETFVTEFHSKEFAKGIRQRRKIYQKRRAKRERSEAELAARRALYEQVSTKRKPNKGKEPKS